MAATPESIGPYRVERQLGQGGMGVVYVCRHPQLARPVAVKQVLSRGVAARPRDALRQLLEGVPGMAMLGPFFERLIGVVFSDEFMRTSMDALTRVGDGIDRSLPWRADDPAGSYRVEEGARGPRLLRSVTMVLIDGWEFDFEGRSRYAGGRLEEAVATQDLVVPPGRARGCTMRWFMKRVR